jgi:uncharacterized SAM-binding protein YcdF (DUF218 family)
MIYLHKILPTFVLHIMLVIIVILIGLIKNKKKLIYIALGILYILSTPIFSNNFFKLVEDSLNNEYRKPISAIDSADAIVVLSGMLGINEVGDSTYIEWGDPDRFFGGIALFKANKAQKLIFTPGKMPWDKAKKTEGEVLREYAISNGIPSEKILVTIDVENTADEAMAVKKLINPSKKIILVTSAFHMYRAQWHFEKKGFIVIPYKIDFKAEYGNAMYIMNFYLV